MIADSKAKEEKILNQILLTISTLPENCPKNKNSYVIAIDGRCAAGKTTLAAHLKENLKCPVIHMDHFFLRPHQRTQERLDHPGENVDHERFMQEVMVPLKEGVPFSYRPYDCHKQEFMPPVRIVPKNFVIIEGSYSCHPALWQNYDLRIFLSVDMEEQIKRIAERGGESAVTAFCEKWIPMEEMYFSTYRLEERCDMRFQT